MVRSNVNPNKPNIHRHQKFMSKPVNDTADPGMRTMTAELVLVVTSPSFEYGEAIPARFTCDGENINPALVVENVPPRARSLALIFCDKTIESKPFSHWVLWNIPPNASIKENSAPGVPGKNDLNNKKYDGPCFTGSIHKYHFTVYALDVLLELRRGSTSQEVLHALEGHIIAASELVGVYPATIQRRKN
jgi:Raf kinase inhibitor-like YbhB/YbcL family protein